LTREVDRASRGHTLNKLLGTLSEPRLSSRGGSLTAVRQITASPHPPK
jgi:hypothetical protein